MKFKATLKNKPEGAREFENGDICIKRDYVKGEPSFGYYKPTKAGYKFERDFWKGNHVTKYNWVKCNDPEFKPGKPKAKPKQPTESEFIQQLNEDLKNTPEVLAKIKHHLKLVK